MKAEIIDTLRQFSIREKKCWKVIDSFLKSEGTSLAQERWAACKFVMSRLYPEEINHNLQGDIQIILTRPNSEKVTLQRESAIAIAGSAN